MISTSNAYKEMMNKLIRNRGYVSVSLGVINQNAQGNASVDTNTSRKYYSKGNLFDSTENKTTYGTLEQNFAKADGTFTFVPRNVSGSAFQSNGIVVPNGGSLIIRFDTAYSIKGLTIDFVETSYPTDMTIVTDEENITISNNTNYKFSTNEVLGSTASIIITPTAMSGGEQCMHIKRVLMGVGLAFSDTNIENVDLDSFVSGISAEISYKDLSISAFDDTAQFDVDNESAFINYLQMGQPVNISFGVDLDNGTQEWFTVASCHLKDWSSKKGRVSFKATDLLSQNEDKYSHMVIATRTAKSEFEAIFASMGLNANEYHIDDYFASVNITNPIEENTYRDCLKYLANATRGIVYEDEDGIVRVEKNFDRQITGSETAITYSGFTPKVDELGKTYYETTNKALYDGTFRTISDKNLFNPDPEVNTAKVENCVRDGSSPLLRVWAENNVFYRDQEALSSAKAIVYTRIKCPKGDFFPITEGGWYCVTIDEQGDYYVDDVASMYAKIGDTYLTIQVTSKKFNFQVPSQAVSKGDLEIYYAFKASRWSLHTNGAYVAIRKGMMANLSEMSDGTDIYENYFANAFPQMNLSWSANTQTTKDVLFVFGDATSKKIRFREPASGGGYVSETHMVDSNLFEHSVPANTNSLDVYIEEAVPNTTLILYEPTRMSSDNYVLPFSNMKEYPYASMEEKIKDIKVKIYSYEEEEGEIREVDDDVWYTETLDSTGVTKEVENPLVSSSAQAELVAKWLKAYFKRNVTYDIEFRGEPSLQANDMMYMENEYTTINVVDVQRTKTSFNGAFSGSIEARKALIVES